MVPPRLPLWSTPEAVASPPCPYHLKKRRHMSNDDSGEPFMRAFSVILQAFAYPVSTWKVLSSLPSVTSKLLFILQRPSFKALPEKSLPKLFFSTEGCSLIELLEAASVQCMHPSKQCWGSELWVTETSSYPQLLCVPGLVWASLSFSFTYLMRQIQLWADEVSLGIR